MGKVSAQRSTSKSLSEETNGESVQSSKRWGLLIPATPAPPVLAGSAQGCTLENFNIRSQIRPQPIEIQYPNVIENQQSRFGNELCRGASSPTGNRRWGHVVYQPGRGSWSYLAESLDGESSTTKRWTRLSYPTLASLEPSSTKSKLSQSF